MVSVMIISVVVASLLKLFSNNTHIISSLSDRLDASMYTSLFVGKNPNLGNNFGFEKDEIYLYDALKDFNLEDDLRRKLKNMKVSVYYNVLEQIDAADMQNALQEQSDTQNSEDEAAQNDAQGSNAASLELGRTTIKFPNKESSSFLRLRMPQ